MKINDLEKCEPVYGCIVADPPWTPTMSIINGPASGIGAPKASPQRHYQTMTLDEIKQMKMPAAKQCHLYLWCLSQHVDWGYEVARAWGFNPIILMTWKKPGLGAGRFRCNTEHFLIARKGSRHGNPFGGGGRYSQATSGTLFEWPRGKHSEKPNEIYELAEKLSSGPRLDVFSRTVREEWDGFGLEYPN